MPQIAELRRRGAQIVPIMSENTVFTDTRFGSASSWRHAVTMASGVDNIICSITGAEPVGPKKLLDLLVVAPCTGNTLAKIANAITDSAVTMAVKAHLRNRRPVLLAISTNDGLGLNARNIGTLLSSEHLYFVPFGQDNPRDKPTSLVARMEMLPEAAELALRGEQMQPVLVEWD